MARNQNSESTSSMPCGTSLGSGWRRRKGKPTSWWWTTPRRFRPRTDSRLNRGLRAGFRGSPKEPVKGLPQSPVAIFAQHLLGGGKRSAGFRLAGSDLAHPVHDLPAPLQLLRGGHTVLLVARIVGHFFPVKSGHNQCRLTAF